jgi:hypothetical protein
MTVAIEAAPVWTRDSHMSVSQLANEGAYKTKLPYPDRVHEPAVLRKRAKELTPDELASIPTVLAEFEAAKIAERAARMAYSDDNGRLLDQMRVDLEAEHGMTGHPKAAMLWAKACEDGHSAGIGEVCSVYENLVDLAK